jgi:hypothetical protein
VANCLRLNRLAEHRIYAGLQARRSADAGVPCCANPPPPPTLLAAGLSPRRNSRRGCCSPHDPAATTGLNDACAVGKGGLRQQGGDRPARRQLRGSPGRRASVTVADRSDAPAFPRLRVRATRRRGTDPRPCFDAARGLLAANASALLVAKCATGPAGGAHRREWSLREPCSSSEEGAGASRIRANADRSLWTKQHRRN